MGRFDCVFSLAALGLIGISVVCLCKTAEYRTQAKFATARYEEMKTAEEKFRREAERKVVETAAEWKRKLQKAEREMEADCQSKVGKIQSEAAAALAQRDELIETLRKQMLKLSNDAVKVIAKYRGRRVSSAAPAVHPYMAGSVVDRSCPHCSGSGKMTRKETCETCDGKGFFVRTNPGGVTRHNVYVVLSQRYSTTKDKCNVCSGRGWTNKSFDCRQCSGTGRIPLKK